MEFVKGIYVKTPHPNAPSFIKAVVSVNVEIFTKYLEEKKNERGYVNFSLNTGKDNNSMYLKLDEWKKPDSLEKNTKEEIEPTIEYPEEEINPDEIPF